MIHIPKHTVSKWNVTFFGVCGLQVLVEPATTWINAITSYGPANLLPYEAEAVRSCEGMVAFVQWATAFALMLAHVMQEVWIRRQFLRKLDLPARPRSLTGDYGWQRRGLGRAFSIFAAFILPVMVFFRLWQALLVMLSWVQQQWAMDQNSLVPLLRFPYLFLC